MASASTRRWSRRGQLPREIKQAWRTSLPLKAPRQVLAAGPTATGWVVTSLAYLSVLDASASDGEGWTHTGWHEIEHGGWNVELGRLQWTRIDGRRGSAQFDEPGRLPAVFRDRVKASIVFQNTVLVTDTAGVVISARRTLADPAAPLEWYATLQRGLTWQQPGVRELADQELARSRAEFDPS